MEIGDCSFALKSTIMEDQIITFSSNCNKRHLNLNELMKSAFCNSKDQFKNNDIKIKKYVRVHHCKGNLHGAKV